MSFAFMPVYTGDYHRDTRHLSMAEHGCYFLALTHCWDQKGPMPLDEKRQFAIVNARSNDEMEAWRRVRDEFFVRMDDGWYQPRMQRETQRAEAISGARSVAGQAGANERMRRLREAQANAKQVLGKSLASDATPTPTLTPTPTTNPKTSTATHERETRAVARSTVPEGVNEATWADYLQVRRAKRAGPPTATAVAGLRREAQKAGLSLQAAVEVCCERGWQSLKAEWLERDAPVAGRPKSAKEAARDYVSQAITVGISRARSVVPNPFAKDVLDV